METQSIEKMRFYSFQMYKAVKFNLHSRNNEFTQPQKSKLYSRNSQLKQHIDNSDLHFFKNIHENKVK